ncbi:proline--tRNA ligase [Candidatus Peregrinibacteria bacterium]|nr:MAG: proline--tRNA ligase [Candidatus Peregrinibacteria bacterium]
MASHITSQEKDFSQWYLDTLKIADVFDYAPVKGCMIIKPYGFKMWELFQQEMNTRMEEMDVENACFPALIPESFIMKEADHVEGFAPELLTVTRVGKKELEEPYVLRPTSETIIYNSYAQWIHSYRDLPLKMNQWANVFRWEMKTKPFLRTSEFFWQEGHTVHATEEEADTMVKDALDMYENFAEEVMAIRGIKGRKTMNETFAGADYTTTIEAMAKDGKAIQFCTSHQLGQSFAKAFDIEFTDKDEKQKTPFITSWGMSTRALGTMFVVHGDDKGLRMPPKIAPIQVMIIPVIPKEEHREAVMTQVEAIKKTLKSDGIRVRIDMSDKRPGFKFAQAEVKGIPIRMEVGPRDLEKNQVVCARRDISTKDSYDIKDLKESIPELLEDIHATLLSESEQHLQQNITDVFDIEGFERVLNEHKGFIRVAWCDDAEKEKEIQQKTGATIRCYPFDMQDQVTGTCFYTGRDATHIALFAKAY